MVGPVIGADFYAGAGGLSYGVELGADGALRVVIVVESNKHAAKSFQSVHSITYEMLFRQLTRASICAGRIFRTQRSTRSPLQTFSSVCSTPIRPSDRSKSEFTTSKEDLPVRILAPQIGETTAFLGYSQLLLC